MDRSHGSTALPERARSSSWGGPQARAELCRIAESARLSAGFNVSAIEVLRGDGLLELVAFTGPRVHEAEMGKSFSLSHVRRVVQAGTSYGKFVFLAEEMDAELQANLVNNAVKYSSPGNSVDLSLERGRDEVVFTCTDQGLGISEKDRQQLFTEFFRSTNPEALQRPGTGLGLTIAARIVARHGGHIDVQSELGEGTIIQVRLPAADPHDPTAGQPRPRAR